MLWDDLVTATLHGVALASAGREFVPPGRCANDAHASRKG